MNKNEYKLLLFFLVLILLGVNYPIIDKVLKNSFSNYEMGFVERVIDGDTLVVNGTSVRLLGINTPEKGEEYYAEAKSFLENRTLHKLVKLEMSKEDRDRYDRKLRYVFIDGENINLQVVEKGYANFYFPSSKDNYYNDFKEAWGNCVDSGKNICKSSKNKCSSCVFLKRLDIEEQKVVFGNKCSFSCDITGWTVKDEGRKRFTFPKFEVASEINLIVGEENNSGVSLFWKGEEYVWTRSGDSLFLRDEEGKLVLWHSY